MIILIDSRERKPLDIQHKFITATERCKLDVGDYGCRYENGRIAHVYFERKSIADLYGTLTTDHERYRREIERAKLNNQVLYLIIEGNLSKVNKGIRYSTKGGEIIVKIIFTMLIRYGIHPIFCKDREECAEFILQYYLAYGRNLDK